jgi:hypothetical protein
MSIAVTNSLGAKEFFELSFVIREQILSMTCEDFSAPKERVFTVSGIKITNYKAHLMPESYNELLFLHGALVSV